MLAESLIHEGPEFIVYKETRSEFSAPLVIKQIKNKEAPGDLFVQLKNELEQTHDLNIPGIRKAIRLENIDEKQGLLLEYVDGVTLKEIFRTRDFSLTEILKIALKIAHIVGEIHQQQLIHKDLNCKNIIVSNDLETVTIIDFGIATRFNLKSDYAINPEGLEGSLAYISPEQTGRMNRAVDARSDLYSLGVVFYELLTGHLPFEAVDPAEYVYCHIARKPVPPSDINTTIPVILSGLVMKLLEKNAENRYQSAFGVKYDLEIILSQLQKRGHADNFPLAQHDYTGRFQISNRLYGREKEVQCLYEAFQHSLEGTLQSVLVCGFSGIGKTSLIHEIHQPVTGSHGFFLEGKFGQFQRNIPYQAFIHAFSIYIKHFLTRDESLLAEWKINLSDALGENLVLLFSLIPELGLLFNGSGETATPSPAESQSQFNYSIIRFIRLIATRENPVVLFLDDMQWSDLASLDLLKDILTDTSIRYFTLIISYRDNEVPADHPLAVTLNEIREENIQLRQIRLKGLEIPDITQLLADSFTETPEQVQHLAGIVHHKTEGNPFFINEFLKALYANDSVSWDPVNNKWKWKLETIREMSVTENVVHFLVQKIRRFPAEALSMLQKASCIGQKFSIRNLSGITGMPVDAVLDMLNLAIREGYVIPVHNKSSRNQMEEALPFSEATFSHDRFLQVIHSMLTEQERREIHHAIGIWILENSGEDPDIFELVSHLNESHVFISKPENKNKLSHLNYEAGLKAKNANAYEEALHYFRVAVTLLSTEAWEKDFNYAFMLSLARAEAEYINLNVNEADQLFDGLMARARNKLEKGYVYERKLLLACTLGKYPEAIRLAREALKLFNINLPRTKAGKYLSVVKNIILMKWRFRNVEAEDLLKLPEVKKEEEKLVTRLFSLTISPVYFSNDFEAYFATFLSLVNYTIVRGNSISSPHIFVTYAIIENHFFQHYRRAYEFGKVCLELNRRNFSSKVRGQLTANLAGGIYHWVMPLRDTFPEFYTGYKNSLEAGDYNYLSININQHIATQIRSGRNLKHILEEFEGFRDWIEKPNDVKMVWEFNLYMFCLHELIDGKDTEETAQFEEAFVRHNREVKFNLGYFYTARSRYYFIQNEYDRLYTMARSAFRHLLFIEASPSHADAVFYYSMAAIMSFPAFSPVKKQLIKRRLRKNIKQFEKWEFHCPANFSAQLFLIRSGYARISNNITEAINYCQKAAQAAKLNQLTQLEAIASEYMGNLCLENNLRKEADQYLQRALHLYARWGATTKVNQLKRMHVSLQNIDTRETVTSTFTGRVDEKETYRFSSENIDLASVIKASTTIAGEVRLDQLISKMMKILIENAGAERGCLILEKGELKKDKIQLDGTSGDFDVFIGIPADAQETLPLSVINYVHRTREEVVADEAVSDFRFSKDIYVQKRKPLSMLCMPILHQNKFSGMLYLENNLATGAFTKDRISMLHLLSGQIAVSINNSILYENLEQKVQDRTEEIVQQKNIIEKEKQQSEKLLLNILPAETAAELKRTGKSQPQRFDNVTVLFTDFVSFSKISEPLEPDEMLESLSFYFGAFDEIVSRYGLEKIKTIGDSYMCAGGLPVRDEANTEKTVAAAIEMRDFVLKTTPERKKNGKPVFQCRFGVHTGQVIAGIIGNKKFAYDIWGNTVNIASRMESSGVPNKVNLSGETYDQIKDKFECTYRGKIALKHEGYIDMFFAERKKQSPGYEDAENFILNRIKLELPDTLYYHGYHHTQDVMQAALTIADSEDLSDDERNLLRVAVAFHDAGFMTVYKDHEEKGCQLAWEILPGFHFTEEQINAVCGMIMATKIPQQPHNRLERIICDADLDYLGREDVYEIAKTLFEELKIHANLTDEKKWNEIQINFLKNHQYYTDFAKKHRQPGKEKYLTELVRNR